MALTPDQLVAKSTTEHSLQTAFFAWLALYKHPDMKWIHAVPNGGERSASQAGRMKAEGVRKGVWDVFIPLRRHGFAGFYIEFKVPGRAKHARGGLSEEQVDFGKFALAEGYRMEVCYSWREAAAHVCDYLGIERRHMEDQS